MARPARLQAAKHWIPTHRGKRIVLGYRRWFAVDRRCAILELRMLGVPVPDSELASARDAEEAARRRKAKKKERLAQEAARREESPVAFLDEWPSETWE